MSIYSFNKGLDDGRVGSHPRLPEDNDYMEGYMYGNNLRGDDPFEDWQAEPEEPEEAE